MRERIVSATSAFTATPNWTHNTASGCITPWCNYSVTATSNATLGYQLRRTLLWAVVTAAAMLTGACTSASSPGTTQVNASTRAPSTIHSAPTTAPIVAGTRTSEQLCKEALAPAVLLDWAPGSASQFRDYKYGGPTATVPLAHAFPGVPGSTSGAWCGTKAGSESTRWWAVVPGREPASLITVNGPGEGVPHGLMSGPPRIP